METQAASWAHGQKAVQLTNGARTTDTYMGKGNQSPIPFHTQISISDIKDFSLKREKLLEINIKTYPYLLIHLIVHKCLLCCGKHYPITSKYIKTSVKYVFLK